MEEFKIGDIVRVPQTGKRKVLIGTITKFVTYNNYTLAVIKFDGLKLEQNWSTNLLTKVNVL